MTGDSRTEIRLAGAGGQGVVTAGRILAEAAVLSGHNASQSQVYGPQSRGGASRADVVIDEEEIGFPLAEGFDVLVILSQEAYETYAGDVGEGGLLVVDAHAAPLDRNGSCGAVLLPIVDTARQITGSVVATGVVAIGVVGSLTDHVDRDALESAVAARVPPRSRDANVRALAAGMQLMLDTTQT